MPLINNDDFIGSGWLMTMSVVLEHSSMPTLHNGVFLMRKIFTKVFTVMFN